MEARLLAALTWLGELTDAISECDAHLDIHGCTIVSPPSALQVLLHLLCMSAAEDVHLRVSTVILMLMDLTHKSSFIHILGFIAAQLSLRRAAHAVAQM